MYKRQASNVVKLEKAKIVDTAQTKRVELHMHSNLSEMDGVCDIKDIVTYVYNLGHRGIAITDHADVQSLVKAYNTAQSLKKKDPDREFRVGLGCEFNLANDELTIVRNATNENLDDVTYISFDLETTGLSCYFDHIIEFGAVRIKNSTIIDRKQLFIKPPVSIPGDVYKRQVLYSALSSAKKNEILKDVASGKIDILIGTHSMIQDSVTFHKLGLTIADEQQRFGVAQRKALKQKGEQVDFLLMSATPIPRTLAASLFGDMDVSTIETMPAGRITPFTTLIKENSFRTVLEDVKRLLISGRQLYVICAAVDENEEYHARNCLLYTSRCV